MEKELIFEEDFQTIEEETFRKWSVKYVIKEFIECTKKEKIIYGVDKRLKEEPIEVFAWIVEFIFVDSSTKTYKVDFLNKDRIFIPLFFQTLEGAKRFVTIRAKYDIAGKGFNVLRNKFKDFDSYIEALEEGLEKE